MFSHPSKWAAKIPTKYRHMNPGNSKAAFADAHLKRRRPIADISTGKTPKANFKSIFQESRLTEEDLEQFQQNILEAHKRKNYRVLIVTAIILTLIGSLLVYLVY